MLPFLSSVEDLVLRSTAVAVEKVEERLKQLFVSSGRAESGAASANASLDAHTVRCLPSELLEGLRGK